MKVLTHSYVRDIAVDYINSAISPRDRADRVVRSRRILDYLHHRKLRAALKKNGGFWGREKTEELRAKKEKEKSLDRWFAENRP